MLHDRIAAAMAPKATNGRANPQAAPIFWSKNCFFVGIFLLLIVSVAGVFRVYAFKQGIVCLFSPVFFWMFFGFSVVGFKSLKID
jgi:uncharacterized membrane protein YdcZ (DUF606 family)